MLRDTAQDERRLALLDKFSTAGSGYSLTDVIAVSAALCLASLDTAKERAGLPEPVVFVPIRAALARLLRMVDFVIDAHIETERMQ